MRFTDKVAVITAFANGIGRATAEIMAREGAIVVGVDNHRDRLDERGRGIARCRRHGRMGGSATRSIAGRSTRRSPRSSRNSARSTSWSTPSAAARSSRIPAPTVDELTFAEWQRLIDFNLSGTFLFTHAVVPIMKRQRQRQDRQPRLDRRPRPQRVEQQRLCRRQGRHHRLHPQARLRARALRRHDQRDRAEPDPDRAHPPALGQAEPRRRRRPRSRARRCAASPRPPTRPRSSAFCLERRRFRDRRHDRRNRRELTAITNRRHSRGSGSPGPIG